MYKGLIAGFAALESNCTVASVVELQFVLREHLNGNAQVFRTGSQSSSYAVIKLFAL